MINFGVVHQYRALRSMSCHFEVRFRHGRARIEWWHGSLFVREELCEGVLSKLGRHKELTCLLFLHPGASHRHPPFVFLLLEQKGSFWRLPASCSYILKRQSLNRKLKPKKRNLSYPNPSLRILSSMKHLETVTVLRSWTFEHELHSFVSSPQQH